MDSPAVKGGDLCGMVSPWGSVHGDSPAAQDQNTIEQLMHQKFEIEQEYQVADVSAGTTGGWEGASKARSQRYLPLEGMKS